jgi:hypothetical protein
MVLTRLYRDYLITLARIRQGSDGMLRSELAMVK